MNFDCSSENNNKKAAGQVQFVFTTPSEGNDLHRPLQWHYTHLLL